MKAEYEKIHGNNSIHFFQRISERFRPYWHYHPEIEITLITQGEGIRYVGDSISHYSNNDLVLVGKNTPHHWVSNPSSNHKFHEAYVIQFKESLFGAIQELKSFQTLFVLARRGVHFPTCNQSIIPLITAFKNSNEMERVSLLIDVLTKLLVHPNKVVLSSSNFISSLKHNDLRLEKIHHYVLTNISQKISIEFVSGLCNMTPQSFCRWFKKKTGYSFISFLNTSRVELSCQLLANSGLPIKEIAYASGFNTISHFNRTFQLLKRQTPTDFRKDSLGENLGNRNFL